MKGGCHSANRFFCESFNTISQYLAGVPQNAVSWACSVYNVSDGKHMCHMFITCFIICFSIATMGYIWQLLFI